MTPSSTVRSRGRALLAVSLGLAAAGCSPSFTEVDDFQMLEVVEYDRPDGVSAVGGAGLVTISGTFVVGGCTGAVSARLRTEGPTLTVRVVAESRQGPCADFVERRGYRIRIADVSPGDYRLVVVHSGGAQPSAPVFDGQVSVGA